MDAIVEINGLSGRLDDSLSSNPAFIKKEVIDLFRLITGTPTSQNHSALFIDRSLAKNIAAHFDKSMAEYGDTFTPSQRGLAIALMLISAQHEINNGRRNPFQDDTDFVYAFHYLNAICEEQKLSNYLSFLTCAEGLTGTSVKPDAGMFTETVSQGYQGYFGGIPGQTYFSNSDYPLSQLHAASLMRIMSKVARWVYNKPLDVLDLGCGSGAYMCHLKEHFSKQIRSIHGVDISDSALEQCAKRQREGLLPIGSVVRANIQNTPYPDQSFDLVYSRGVINCLPLVDENGPGMGQVFHEARRLLRPDGLLYVSTRQGSGREYLPFQQLIDVTDVERLCDRHGFQIVEIENYRSTMTGKYNLDKYRVRIDFLLKAAA